MNTIGYYDTQDQTGGQSFRLTWKDGKLVDDRPVQKYYKENKSATLSSSRKNFLFAFAPLY